MTIRLCLLAAFASLLCADQIVLIPASFSQIFVSYDVNTQTGELSPTPHLAVGGSATTGRAQGRYFAQDLNLYEAPVPGLIGSPAFQNTMPFRGIAYDPFTAMFYGASETNLFPVPSLPTIPGAFDVAPLGAFGVNLQAIDFVPGVGLLGLNSTGVYEINTTTGTATLRTATALPLMPGYFVGDFAFDPKTGQLITTLVSANDVTQIYGVNFNNGAVALINASAPQGISGVARIETPEPATGFAAAAAVLLVLAVKRRALFLWYL